MNFEQHYGEMTHYIQLDGSIPLANSMPLSVMFLGKKQKKGLKKTDIKFESFMNICYEKEQPLVDGSTYEWKLNDQIMSVYLIDSTKLFVKGKLIWAYCVGIIE